MTEPAYSISEPSSYFYGPFMLPQGQASDSCYLDRSLNHCGRMCGPYACSDVFIMLEFFRLYDTISTC